MINDHNKRRVSKDRNKNERDKRKGKQKRETERRKESLLRAVYIVNNLAFPTNLLIRIREMESE